MYLLEDKRHGLNSHDDESILHYNKVETHCFSYLFISASYIYVDIGLRNTWNGMRITSTYGDPTVNCVFISSGRGSICLVVLARNTRIVDRTLLVVKAVLVLEEAPYTEEDLINI